MKKFYALLLFLLSGLGIEKTAFAGHVQGAELGYTCLAPNLYAVRLKVYRDCAALSLPTTLPVNLKAGGCNNGRTVIVTRVGNPRTANPYCSQQTVTCNSGGLPTFEEHTYSATVTFTAAEAQCPDWVFSLTDCNRGPSANIVNAQSICMYVDAFLKLGAGINNNSPEFSQLDVLNVAWNQKITYSSYALEMDGDSIVYSLQSALSNASTPVTYRTGLTGTNPIESAPALQLDRHTGALNMLPNLAPVPGSNQYTIVVQIDEFRKLNGVATRVGSSKRDMIVVVVNSQVGGNSNANPYVTNPLVNGQSLPLNAEINATAGMPLTFQVDAFDPNVNDVLTMSSDAALVLPGAAFAVAGTPLKGTLTWTPAAVHVRDQPYYIHVNIKDDFCLTRGIHTSTYAVRVSNTQNPTGIRHKPESQVSFTAYPNPFSSEVTFRIGAGEKLPQVLIYNALGQQVDQINSAELNGSSAELIWHRSSGFPAGTYTARLLSGGKPVKALKFMKL